MRDAGHWKLSDIPNPRIGFIFREVQTSNLRRLRDERSDKLLTVLTGVLVLLIFVFAPLQAIGITAFHLFAIGLLLAIIGSMVIISNSPTALVLMSAALLANIAVFFLRL